MNFFISTKLGRHQLLLTLLKNYNKGTCIKLARRGILLAYSYLKKVAMACRIDFLRLPDTKTNTLILGKPSN